MKKSLGAKVWGFPCPVWVVGTYDKDGKPNAMTASWAGACCSRPPCVGVSLRKATATYGNIMARKAFTINVPPEEYMTQTDYFGIVSGKNTDKFAKTGLAAVKSELVDAPYVQEFPLVLECKLIHSLAIGLHTWFVGEILDVKVEEDIMKEEDVPPIEKIKPFLFSPEIRLYHGVGKCLGKAFSAGERFR